MKKSLIAIALLVTGMVLPANAIICKPVVDNVSDGFITTLEYVDCIAEPGIDNVVDFVQANRAILLQEYIWQGSKAKFDPSKPNSIFIFDRSTGRYWAYPVELISGRSKYYTWARSTSPFFERPGHTGMIKVKILDGILTLHSRTDMFSYKTMTVACVNKTLCRNDSDEPVMVPYWALEE